MPYTSFAISFLVPVQEGIHPLLAAALPSDALGGLEAQAGLADIAAALKSYRPSQTVFEAEVAPARKGQGAGGRCWCHTLVIVPVVIVFVLQGVLFVREQVRMFSTCLAWWQQLSLNQCNSMS